MCILARLRDSPKDFSAHADKGYVSSEANNQRGQAMGDKNQVTTGQPIIESIRITLNFYVIIATTFSTLWILWTIAS